MSEIIPQSEDVGATINEQGIPEGNSFSESFWTKKKTLILIALSIALFLLLGLSIFLLIKDTYWYSNFAQKMSPHDKEPLAMVAPKEGWNSEDKKYMNDLLLKMDYYQPSYLPLSFQKVADGPNNDFAIYSLFKSSTNSSQYATLTMQQYPVEEVNKLSNSLMFQRVAPRDKVIANFEKIENEEGRDPKRLEKLTINGYPAIYIETPGYALDPYFSLGFGGSEDEKKLATKNDRTLLIYMPKQIIELTLGFAFDVSSDESLQELTKMGESLAIAQVAPELKITDKDALLIEQEALRMNAHNIAFALLSYYKEKGSQAWELDSNCNNGQEPATLLASSPEFKSCLEDIKADLYGVDDPQYYNPDLFSQLFVTGHVNDQLVQEGAERELKIIPQTKPGRSRVCYQAKVMNEYVGGMASESPPFYIDGYPMFNQKGEIDLSCKDDPVGKGCYYCEIMLEKFN